MSNRLTRSQVLRSNDTFREQVKTLARVAMNECGVVWREIDIDEIAIVAVNKMRLYERACIRLGVAELSDTPRPTDPNQARDGED